MCGFTAIIDPHHNVDVTQREIWVRAMAEPLSYRGRDDEQYFMSKDKIVTGLFRRLPVQGVGKAGTQPMSEGDFTLFFNGEIYNYIELKQRLKNDFKCQFKSDGDTEVLLKAFIHWGVEHTISELDGMFAILLCDHKRKKYYIINDIYGEKPLFYRYKDSVMYISSSVQSFKTLSDTRLNHKALHYYLSYGFVPKPMSIFDDVVAIEPNQIIVFDRIKDRLEKSYYQTKRHDYHYHENDCVHDFEALFTQSLSRRLRSQRKKGLFLSGGVDSGLILATACLSLQENLPCYTLSFQSREDAYDESMQARSMAKQFGVDHHVLPIDDRDLARIIPNKLATLDQPLADAAYFPLAALTDFAARDCVVMLGGEGGDELQAGYARHEQEHRLKQLWYYRQWLRPLWPVLKPCAKLTGTVFGQTQWVRKLDKIEHMLKNTQGNSAYDSLLRLWNTGTHYDFRGDFRENDIVFFLPNQLLPKFDNATMQATIEGRTPYLNKALFDMMEQTPRHVWASKNLAKTLLDHHDIEITPKKGLTVPIADYLRGDLKEWAYDALTDFSKMDVIPKQDIWASWDKLQKGRTAFAQPIWALIIFCAWQRAHNLSI